MAIQRKKDNGVLAEKTDENSVEIVVENILRPKKLMDFVGQKTLKENLSVILGAAKKRGETAPHLLFYGPPGLGKTTLAGIVAAEMGGNLKFCSGPAVEKAGDLAAILSNLEAGDVLFLDEIHRLRRPVEEILYSALEDFVLDLVVGKGPGARSMRLSLPRFTLIAATTRLASLSAPLRDRFGETFRLELYDSDDLESILLANATKLEVRLEPSASHLLAQSARGTPRIVNRLLARLRDFAHFQNTNEISGDLAHSALAKLGVDQTGLTSADREFLEIIADKFAGGPVGLSTLAAASGEERETIEDIREPFLLQLGFLARTPKGRILTPAAFDFLGKKSPFEQGML